VSLLVGDVLAQHRLGRAEMLDGTVADVLHDLRVVVHEMDRRRVAERERPQL
jgi:hypothetical protein